MSVGDIFPPANLPPEAGEWRRAIEQRIINAEYGGVVAETDISAQNRTSAAGFADLSRQVQRVNQAYVQLEAVVLALPVPMVRSGGANGFGLGGGWQTVASATVTPPSGKPNCTITAFGSAFLRASGGASYVLRSRVVIAGSVGAEFLSSNAASGFTEATVGPTHGRTFSTTSAFTVDIQFQADNPGSYSANGENYAVIVADATFTG